MKKLFLPLFFAGACGLQAQAEVHPLDTAPCKKFVEQLQKRAHENQTANQKEINPQFEFIRNVANQINLAEKQLQSTERSQQLNQLKSCVAFFLQMPSYLESVQRAQPYLDKIDRQTFPFPASSRKELEMMVNAKPQALLDEKFKAIIADGSCKALAEDLVDQDGSLDKQKMEKARSAVFYLNDSKATISANYFTELKNREIKIPQNVYQKAFAVETCLEALNKFHQFIKAQKDLEQYFTKEGK